MKREIEMTEIERCQRVLDGANRGLAAVFGENKIKCEICDAGNQEICLVLDGWICFSPVVEIPKEKWFKSRHGKEHLIKYTEEHALWAITTVHQIPGGYWEPPDVDINDVDTVHFGEAMVIAINLIAKNIYNQWCECESEKEMDKLENN